jgi:hypothetical protein
MGWGGVVLGRGFDSSASYETESTRFLTLGLCDVLGGGHISLCWNLI